METFLFLIGMTSAICTIIWATALIFWLCDQRPIVVRGAATSVECKPSPHWARWLVFPLILVMVPALFVFLIILLAPIFVWHLVVGAFCWCRFRLDGTPIPLRGPIDEVDEATF